MPIVTSDPETVAAPRRPAPWQCALREAIRDPRELCRLLELPASYEARAVAAAEKFPLLVPRGFAARMTAGDPHDPLLRQVLPLDDELVDRPGFVPDPLGEFRTSPAEGLLEKYRGRVLIVTTGACAVHCRYCFRRHFPYGEAAGRLEDWGPAVERIAADATIHEVLLSGGDPLMLSDARLAALAGRLAEIGHVRRLRVHTRLPIVLPQRVCDELFAWLCGTRLTPVVVVHANHPAELDESVAAAIARLVAAGVMVLNQAVLLRGVNDTAGEQIELCERLLALRVLPYYLHQLDRVAGAGHFEVPESEGRALVEQLRAALPGYAVPRYVREVPDAPYKIPLT